MSRLPFMSRAKYPQPVQIEGYSVNFLFFPRFRVCEAARKRRSVHKMENSLLRFIKRVPIDRLRALHSSDAFYFS